jgi:hypothetical protein
MSEMTYFNIWKGENNIMFIVQDWLDVFLLHSSLDAKKNPEMGRKLEEECSGAHCHLGYTVVARSTHWVPELSPCIDRQVYSFGIWQRKIIN